MKRVMIICLTIFTITNTVVASQTNENNELIDIITITQQNEMDIESWEITLKEKMEKEQLKNRIEEMKDRYMVTRNEDENSIKYTLVNKDKQAGINETIRAIFPKNELLKAELIVILDGQSWNSEIKTAYIDKKEYYLTSYFTDSVQIYACMSTIDSAIINNDYFIQDLTEKLKLRHFERFEDNIKTDKNTQIIYAYSPIWNQSITIQDKPTNIQIVIQHTSNNEVKYTIGTPILINEY